MRVLVTGAAGQLGRAFRALAPAEARVTALTRADLDITDEDAVRRAVGTHQPQWIINAAAYTAVDKAEGDAQAAHALNATAVGYLARAAESGAARLVHLSSDFVFDGRADTPYESNAATAPLSVYGATKLAGERQALDSGARAIVVRTSWVYAAYGQNFVRTMLRLMAERPEVRVVCDQIGSPTWATALAQIMWRLLALDAAAGIYHWSDAGTASWHDFAVAIQQEALERGLLRHAVPVLAIGTHEYPTAARRPPYSVLDSTRTRTLTGIAPTPWRTQLRKMLDELAAG